MGPAVQATLLGLVLVPAHNGISCVSKDLRSEASYTTNPRTLAKRINRAGYAPAFFMHASTVAQSLCTYEQARDSPSTGMEDRSAAALATAGRLMPPQQRQLPQLRAGGGRGGGRHVVHTGHAVHRRRRRPRLHVQHAAQAVAAPAPAARV